MKIEIKIPAMGESIAEATIGNILKSSGEFVQADTEILELETDKVNQVLYAPQAGELSLNVQAGDIIKIGQVIGFIETDKQQAAAEPAKRPPAKEAAPVQKEEPKQPKKEVQPSLERKQRGQGEIFRQSKEQFIQSLTEPSSAPPSAPTVEKAPSQKVETRQKMSTIRKVIAKRLVEAQHSAAMLTTFNEIDLSKVIEMRDLYKETFIKEAGVKLGFMSFFVKASVSALKAFPHLNSYIDGDEIVHREYYAIGIAIGGEKGLVVPVLRDCDRLSLAEIEKSIDQFVLKSVVLLHQER